MVDGAIRVKTRLDNSEIPKDVSELNKMLDDAKNVILEIAKSLNMKVNPITVVDKEVLKSAEKEIDSIGKKIAEIKKENETKINNIMADKSLRYDKAEEKVFELLKQERDEVGELVEKRNQLTEAVEKYKLKLVEVKKEQEYQKQDKTERKAAVKDVKSDVSGSMAADDFLSKIQTVEQYNAALEQTQLRLQAIEDETRKIATEKGIDPNEVLKTNTEYQKLQKRMQALVNDTRKLKSESKGSFETAKKGAQQLGDSIKGCIKQMAKYTLAVFGARSAFYAVKNAIRQVLADNEQLNNTVTAMKGVFANAITPYVERLVYYLQYAMAYLNLFIKTLTGVDLVANYNAKALQKQAKATSDVAKAAKEAKSQLMGFDEKNMLSSNKNADSDSSAIENAAATLNLPDVSDTKFAKICETIKIYLNELEAAAGVALVAIGLILLACGQITFGIAAIIAGVALEAKALGNWKELEDRTKTMIKAILGIAGLLFLVLGIILCATGVKIPIGVALIAFGATAIIGAAILSSDEINGFIERNIDTIAKLFVGVALGLLVLGIILCAAGVSLPIGLALIAAGAIALVSTMALSWNKLSDETKKTISVIAGIAGAALLVLGIILCVTTVALPLGLALIAAGAAGLVTAIAVNKDGIKNLVSQVWSSVKSFWNNNIAKVFTAQWWSNKLSSIAQGAKAALNTAIGFVEKMLNSLVNKLNTFGFIMPEWVPVVGGKHFGINLSTINIPRLAKGGIVSNPGRGVNAIIGEAGREAVLPLENNTEWMDILADKLAERQGITIVKVYLDSNEIRSQSKTERRYTFATNGGVL